MEAGGALVADGDDPELAGALDGDAARAGLLRLLGIHLGDGVRGLGEDAVEFLDQAEPFLGFEVADEGDGGVVGPVEGVVECAELLDGDFLDVAAVADGRVVVGVGGEGGLVDFLDEGLEGRVLATLEFVAHDGHLGLAVVVVELEVAHAVGLHLDGHGEVLAAEGLVVVGAVEVGGGVVLGAGALEELVDVVALGAVAVERALEHQVLEQVGGAGGARDLVARADTVGDHEGQHRHGVVG